VEETRSGQVGRLKRTRDNERGNKRRIKPDKVSFRKAVTSLPSVEIVHKYSAYREVGQPLDKTDLAGRAISGEPMRNKNDTGGCRDWGSTS